MYRRSKSYNPRFELKQAGLRCRIFIIQKSQDKEGARGTKIIDVLLHCVFHLLFVNYNKIIKRCLTCTWHEKDGNPLLHVLHQSFLRSCSYCLDARRWKCWQVLHCCCGHHHWTTNPGTSLFTQLQMFSRNVQKIHPFNQRLPHVWCTPC